MPIDYESGGDISTGGKYLTEPGFYHFLVLDTNEKPTNKDGVPIDGGLFSVTLGVLDGTTAGQKDKVSNVTFRRGKPGDEGSEKFARKRNDRFFLATGLLTLQQIESRARVSIDIAKANGQQLVAKYTKEKPEDKYANLEFAEIYHVDDPAVAHVPKDQKALSTILPAKRWPGGTAPGTAAPATAAAPSTPTAPPATEFDDLDV
jgi:hypothetical protein